MRIEKEGREALTEIRKSTIIAKPRGVGLTRALMNQWLAYLDESKRIEIQILGPIEVEIEEYVSASAGRAEIPLMHFTRIDAAVRSRTGDAVGAARRLKRASDESVSQVAVLARTTARESFKAVNEVVDEVINELEQLKRSQVDAEVLSQKRRELEGKVDEAFERERETLERLKEQFDALGSYWSKDGFDTVDLTEALEEELEELRAQRDFDLEMAQNRYGSQHY